MFTCFEVVTEPLEFCINYFDEHNNDSFGEFTCISATPPVDVLRSTVFLNGTAIIFKTPVRNPIPKMFSEPANYAISNNLRYIIRCITVDMPR